MDLEKGESVTRTKTCTSSWYIVTIFLLIIILLLIPFSVLYLQNIKHLRLMAEKLKLVTKLNVFMDPHRLQIMNDFVTKLDTKMDPCEDFYKYTCGTFDSRALNSDLYELQSNINLQITRLLDKPLKKDTELKAFQMAKSFYRSCMNQVEIEKDGIRLFHEIFSNIHMPFKMFQDWNEDEKRDWKLDDALIKAKMLYDMPILFDVYLDQDSSNASLYVMALHVEKIRLFDQWIEGDQELTQAYLIFMHDMLTNLIDTKVDVNKLMNVMQFERRILNTYVPRHVLYTPENYKKISIQQLKDYIPTFEWLDYFQSLPIQPLPSHHSETATSSLHPLQDIFNIITQTSQETLANFITWSLVKVIISEFELPQKYDDIYFNFENATFPTDSRTPKIKKCVDSTTDNFEFAVGRVYTDEHFDERNKLFAIKIIEDFKAEYVRMIEECDWMDDDTKKYAVKKARKIKAVVGYSDQLGSDSFINMQHQGLEIDENKYNDNIISIKKFLMAEEWKDINKKPMQELLIGKVEVNAYYSSSHNTIVFPASILQHPVFKWTYPAAVNYGSIGNTIGHELTHAFDTAGKEYDADNNMRNWWTKKTNEAYSKKAECFQEQYHNYTLSYEDLKIDGHKTLSENMADVGGLKAAFRAYTRYLHENGDEEGLNDVPFNSKQLFFLAFSKLFCTRGDKSYLMESLHLDHHSPAQARINIPLQNLPEFSEAFSCVKGSRMNPIHKCSFW